MCSILHLLTVGVCIWAAFLLEGIVETGLDLHALTDIIDHPDCQTLCCRHLQHTMNNNATFAILQLAVNTA